MKRLIFLSAFSLLLILNACSKSETEEIIENPLEPFIGEWSLVSEVSDGVEVNNSEIRLMEIGDNLIETDILGYLNWIYPNVIDSFTLEVYQDEELMKFWQGTSTITWICYYDFIERDQMTMVDSFPGGPVVVTTWARQ